MLDEDYNSIYVPPGFKVPEDFTLIEANVDHICKKLGYFSARIVQGFDVAGMHIVPNNIGYLVKSEHAEEVQRLVIERMERAKLKKEERKTDVTKALWRKLIKSIIVSQQY